MSQEYKDPQYVDRSEGLYANYFEVGHNTFEFVLDFGQYYSEDGEPQIHTRIITNPAYAKAFSGTLQESIDKYEQKFGAIPKRNN